MRVFKVKRFAKWAKKHCLSDDHLKVIVSEVEAGLISASLGGSLFKKRIALTGRGKRGGYRSILACRENDRLCFIYGYAKNEQDNVSKKEMDTARMFTEDFVEYTHEDLDMLVEHKIFQEVMIDEQFA